MTDSLHPESGVRYLFEHVGGSRDRAAYRATIYTQAEAFEYAVGIGLDGTIEAQPIGKSAATGDENRLLGFARSFARAAKQKVEDGLAPWPPRILRWRGPGRG